MPDTVGLLVMVVEPHLLFRELIVELLERLPLVRLVQANTAQSALAQAKTECPSVVVMDVTLPDLPMPETVRRLKEVAPQLDVVLVGDQPIGAYRERALRSGAALCLRKEELASELLPALLRLSRKNTGRPGA